MGCCDSKHVDNGPRGKKPRGAPIARIEKSYSNDGTKGKLSSGQAQNIISETGGLKDSMQSSKEVSEQPPVNLQGAIVLQDRILPKNGKNVSNNKSKVYGIKTQGKDPFFSSYESEDFQTRADDLDLRKRSHDVNDDQLMDNTAGQHTRNISYGDTNQIQEVVQEQEIIAEESEKQSPEMMKSLKSENLIETEQNKNQTSTVPGITEQIAAITYDAYSQEAVKEVQKIIAEQTKKILEEYDEQDKKDTVEIINYEENPMPLNQENLEYLKVIDEAVGNVEYAESEEEEKRPEEQEEVVEEVAEEVADEIQEESPLMHKTYNARIVEEELGLENEETSMHIELKLNINKQNHQITGIIQQEAPALISGQYNQGSLEATLDLTLNNKVEVVEGRFLNDKFSEFQGTIRNKTSSHELEPIMKISLIEQQSQ